jgi:hypothetical protein
MRWAVFYFEAWPGADAKAWKSAGLKMTRQDGRELVGGHSPHLRLADRRYKGPAVVSDARWRPEPAIARRK